MSDAQVLSRSTPHAAKQVALVVPNLSALDWRLDRWLRTHCEIEVHASIGALLANGNVESQDLVLLVANRSRSFHQRDVDQVILQAPFVRMVSINSDWSDGDSRNSQQLSGVMHVHWTSGLAYLERWRLGAIEFPLSRIQSSDVQPSWIGDSSVGGKVVSVASDPVTIELWKNVFTGVGVESHNYRERKTSDVLLIDNRVHGGDVAHAIADAIGCCGESCVILLSHMPREHSVAQCKRLGVDHVLRHPVSLPEVMSIIQNAKTGGRLSEAA